jgi:TIR domain
MAGPSVDIFEQLCGFPVMSVCRALLADAKLPVGFEAQEHGRGQLSASSTGIVTYAIASCREVADEVVRPLVAEMEGWLTDAGELLMPENTARAESTWANGQCLVALAKRPHLIGDRVRVRRFAERLVGQHVDGGSWPLRPGLRGTEHPIFSVYPILALRAAQAADLVDADLVQGVFAQEARWLASVAATGDAATALCSLGLLGLVGGEQSASVRRMIDDLERRLWQDGNLQLATNITVSDSNQPIWHALLWRPSMYLLARRLWSVNHPINVSLASGLLTSFDRQKLAWGRDETPVSWMTALGFVATMTLARDLVSSGVSADEWQGRIDEVRDGSYEFDVVISFSGSQRRVANAINRELKAAGFFTFYDYDQQHRLLGEDLAQLLQRVYFRRSRYAVAVLSKDFVNSKWAGNWEWKAILARMQEQEAAYLLPYFYEKVEVPGLNPTIGHISRDTHTPRQFAAAVIRRLREEAAARPAKP